MVDVRVQSEPFDAGAELACFTAGAKGAGAVVSFTGIVRDLPGGMSRMEIEHYPCMTERAISGILAEAQMRWGLSSAMVIHRHGTLLPGEPIMMVATAAPHRAAAFASADFLMDYLKSRAPFWKKEYGPDGAEWVVAKEQDEDALSRWQR